MDKKRDDIDKKFDEIVKKIKSFSIDEIKPFLKTIVIFAWEHWVASLFIFLIVLLYIF